jgi:hypothetical protein
MEPEVVLADRDGAGYTVVNDRPQKSENTHKATRATIRRARCELQNTLGGRGARERRADLIATRILRGILTEAVDHFVEKSLRLERWELARELRLLREAAVEGIGGLLWGARGHARRQLRELLDDIAGGSQTLVKKGLVVAAEGPRSRRREYDKTIPEDLRLMLEDVRRGKPKRTVGTYLAGLSPSKRLEKMRPAAEALVAVLGSDVVAKLLEDGEISLIDNVRFFAPFLNPSSRRHVLRKAISAQCERGDETSCVALFMAAAWFDVAEAAQAFACCFNTFGRLDPANNLYNLVRRHGHIYWSVPLLRKLGGDGALVSVGREVVAAVWRAVREARRSKIQHQTKGAGKARPAKHPDHRT